MTRAAHSPEPSARPPEPPSCRDEGSVPAPEQWCVRCQRSAPPVVMYQSRGRHRLICRECHAAEEALRKCFGKAARARPPMYRFCWYCGSRFLAVRENHHFCRPTHWKRQWYAIALLAGTHVQIHGKIRRVAA